MSKKTTPAQRFAQLFRLFMDSKAQPGERAAAERKVDEWLKHHNKVNSDIPSILAQAAADDAAAQPPPPPSDPRDTQPHPYEDPRFTPIGLVHGITGKYLWMAPHVAVIYSAWIVFTHVYPQFKIAPRLAPVSKLPNSGKTVAVDVAKRLVLRPNAESFSTTAALEEFIKGGSCTIGLDELDLIGRDARRALLLLWNLGHKRGEKRALMEGKHREQHNLHAPMIAAGLGTFLAPASMTRTYVLEMEKYTEETKPEREFDDTDTADLDKVYAYLRQWATRVKLNLKPPMPKGVIARDADNACGMVAVADACGPEWGQRVREAITFLLEKAVAERPEIVMIRHGLAIFDTLEIDRIRSTRYKQEPGFNQELKRLDLPGADWMRFRGLSGTEREHPLTLSEQVALAGMVDIEAKQLRPAGEGRRGKQFRGYTLEQFEAAHRKYCMPGGAGPGELRPRPRLIASD